MGYTCGRRLTEDVLREIAKKYKTRSEFQHKDSSAYVTARKRGKEFLDSICSHMLNVSFSIPQLICKFIMETILEEISLYNSRKIIPQYELDVYFPSYRLALEYCGKRWHSSKDVMERDEIKKKLCESLGITLLVINENSRDYENDVKNQIIKNLDVINQSCDKAITEKQILDINCDSVYKEIAQPRI